MANIANLLTEHMDIWSAAESEKKSGRGRVSGNAGSIYGVKKLRELILELAVRGKLVPQDPNDEPASEMLKRIQAEKAKLNAEGKLKKEKPLAPIGEDEKPFELPNGWVWLRLGQTGRIFNGNSINENEKLDKYTNLKNGYPFIATKDVGYGREELDYDNGVLIPKEDCSLKVAKKSAVLICAEGGSAGKKVGITNQDICFGNKLFANEVWTGIEPFYIFHLYQSVTFYSLFQQKMTGIIGGISLNEFLSIPVPIPPLAEQHRIVTKVNELMALCDQLEQQHSNAQEAHETLVSQLLSTLAQSQNAAEFNVNWQRIYAHFDVLFNTETSIDALKQTLLQLAVMGKLVRQDPNDEPASELLKRIQAEKAKLIAEGKLKKEKPLAPIGEDEKPFELPNGWEWTTLLNVAFVNPRNNAPDDIEASFVPMTYIGSEFSDKHQDEKRLWKDIKQGFTHFAEGDIGVAKITPCFENSKACVFENLENGLGAGTTELHIVRPVVNTLNPRYVLAYLKSPRFLEIGESKMTGTAGQKRLPKDFVETNPFPLPPLAEQNRIVAKVIALMALCDQLKTRIQQASQQQQLIADALVSQVIS